MAITGGTYLALTAHNPLGGISSALPADDLEFFKYTEDVTISTAGTTTDTSAGFLPANAIILGVLCTITTTVGGGGASSLSVGDSSTAARWGTTAALTAGSSNIALAWTPFKGTISTDATGPTVGATALAVRLTVGGGTPTAGAVRVTAFGFRLKAGSV
jgi:hypothetical protein